MKEAKSKGTFEDRIVTLKVRTPNTQNACPKIEVLRSMCLNSYLISPMSTGYIKGCCIHELRTLSSIDL